MTSVLRAARRAVRFLGNAVRPGVEVVPVEAMAVDWDVPIAMRDGTVLRANVFRPHGQGPFPVIMSAHPYGKDKIPAKTRTGRGPPLQSRFLPQPHPIRISAYTSWEAPDPAVWVDAGYAVVNADLRGGGTSDGIADLFSDEEARDYYELIEWAGTQGWSNGRVGLDGASYLAISQYKVAALQPPHLTAICPWEGLTDVYRDFARPGGVLENGFSKLWSRLTGREARVRASLYDAICAHPERDEWYAARTPRIEDIAVPILVCGSFSDHLLHSRGSFELFRRAGSRDKWLYTHRDGKWCAYYGAEATATRRRFFDHFLKREDNGWEHEPRVRLAIADDGPEPAAVMYEDAWPPADIQWRRLRLDAGSGAMHDATDGFLPASASLRLPDGRVSFVWTVEQDLDVIGPMALYLDVLLRDGADALLFAGLRKLRGRREAVFEGSYGFSGDMVSTGWQRIAHRTIDAALSTPAAPVHTYTSPEPARPGEVVRVAIALRPHATRLRAGDRLRLDLQGRWFYPYNPLFGQFPAAYQASPVDRCTILTGGPDGAYLLLATRPPRGDLSMPGRAA
ncbi:CocE/NonD family hydrolase [uncultured Sphingomonas sp.]|uniref:CocE/NonD family hydrolase n=1 Tax=uncultured Sphingomonas sp. TaxID=158754 RepID=UPI0035CA8AF4